MTPDNSPTAAAMPEPAPPRARAQYALNDEFTRLLEQAETVNEAARDPRFAADLSARGINAAFTDAQKTDIERGRTLLQNAHAGRNQGKAATQSKSATRQTLELLIGQIQSAALQRDMLDETDKAANYYIGADVAGANESQLDAIAEGIIEQLSHDDIPGVTPADEAAFEAATHAYDAEISAARDARKDPQSDQMELEALLSKIKRYKQATQLAADAQYPFNQLGPDGARVNHVTRQLFELPVSRKYRPAKKRD